MTKKPKKVRIALRVTEKTARRLRRKVGRGVLCEFIEQALVSHLDQTEKKGVAA